MNEVQAIECKNSAWFVMSFSARSADKTSDPTGKYPIGQSAGIELSGAGFAEGDEVWPEVYALAGKTFSSDDHVTFKRNGKKAVYEVTGVTWDFKVKLVDIVDDGAGLPDFPPGILVTPVSFENWAQAIHVASVWCATPSTAADVVTICNWAKEYGYTVRATGIKHTWSPITVPDGLAATAKVMLVDTSNLNSMELIQPANGQPAMVRTGTGVTTGELMSFLQQQQGNGVAPGYSFANTPAPDHLTIGGVLAINGHGTSVPTSTTNDDFPIGYGSMSNTIMEFTAVVTDPGGTDPESYQLKTFRRSDKDAKAFLTHLGRTIIVEAVMQVIDNYNLSCLSITDIAADTLFAAPSGSKPPADSLAEFLQNSGRVEAIWFPFTSCPWFKVWTVAPTMPEGYRQVDSPNNYPFSDNLPVFINDMIKEIVGNNPQRTPEFGQMMFSFTNLGLDLSNARKLWGASKNTMFYVKDTTLRVTANGYAVLMKKENVQQAVHDFAKQFEAMLKKYQSNNQFPINSPLEIRVTGLDSAASVPPGMGGTDSRPVISSLSVDQEVTDNGWDVALWLDVLTLPGTRYSDDFYAELEQWFLDTYKSPDARVVPEWSKGWAYDSSTGPWTNTSFMTTIRETFMGSRAASDDWNWEVATLAKYDQYNLFTNPLLGTLFVNA